MYGIICSIRVSLTFAPLSAPNVSVCSFHKLKESQRTSTAPNLKSNVSIHQRYKIFNANNCFCLFYFIFRESAFFWSDCYMVRFCVYQNADVQILGQIEICLDSNFTILDCEKQLTVESISKGDLENTVDKLSGFSVCDHDMPVYYPPLPQNTYMLKLESNTLYISLHTYKTVYCLSVNCTVIQHASTDGLRVILLFSGFTMNCTAFRIMYCKYNLILSVQS